MRNFSAGYETLTFSMRHGMRGKEGEEEEEEEEEEAY